MTQTNQKCKQAVKCSPTITTKAKTGSKICPRDLTSPQAVLQADFLSVRLHPLSVAPATLKKVNTRPCVQAKSLLNQRAETRTNNLKMKATIRLSCTSQMPLITQTCSSSTILIRETMSISSRCSINRIPSIPTRAQVRKNSILPASLEHQTRTRSLLNNATVEETKRRMRVMCNRAKHTDRWLQEVKMWQTLSQQQDILSHRTDPRLIQEKCHHTS